MGWFRSWYCTALGCVVASRMTSHYHLEAKRMDGRLHGQVALLEYRGDMLPIPMHKEGILHHFRDFFFSCRAVTSGQLQHRCWCLPLDTAYQ